jgi:hypothetical protein
MNEYLAGTAWETVHYATNGDALDWQYGDQESKPLIFCGTPETGGPQDGFWPPVYRIPALNAGMLPVGIYIAKIAGDVRSIAAPEPSVLNPIGSIDTTEFTVSWTHDDEYNPAVVYELVEKTGYSRATDNLESGLGNWEHGGFMLSTTRYHSHNHSLYSGSDDNYHAEAVMAEPLAVQEGDTLDFWIWYDTEDDWDYAYVEVSTDGLTYVPIKGNITTNTNPNGQNRGNGITGSSSGWVNAHFPLDEFVGQSLMIKITYITDSEDNETGVYIDDIAPIESFENSIVLGSDIVDISFLVEGRPDGDYYYQVRAKDLQDQWSQFSNRGLAVVDIQVAIDDDPSAVPQVFNLAQNYPNPFNARTEISFVIASPGLVKLEVLDISGRLVKTLVDSYFESGRHTLIWDGTNSENHTIASGVYFYKLSTAANSEIKRMTLLK